MNRCIFNVMDVAIILMGGWLVSFLGQLPLGNMSFTATQIAVEEHFKNAWKYAIGVALVEMLYLRLALTSMDWVVQHRTWFLALGWLTVVLFFLLSYLSFQAARQSSSNKKAVVLNNKLPRFVLGLTMSALNPVQIPFWFLWTSQWIAWGWLPTERAAFNYFTLGAGLGTIAGLALYIHGGNYIVKKFEAGNQRLNQVIGVIFFITALIQLYRMVWQPWI
jgi:threonine/homoserine/homoserine lactone efflux protein